MVEHHFHQTITSGARRRTIQYSHTIDGTKLIANLNNAQSKVRAIGKARAVKHVREAACDPRRRWLRVMVASTSLGSAGRLGGTKNSAKLCIIVSKMGSSRANQVRVVSKPAIRAAAGSSAMHGAASNKRPTCRMGVGTLQQPPRPHLDGDVLTSLVGQ